MHIHVTCDGCGQALRLNQSDAGKNARCPKCATMFTIPAEGQSSQPAPPMNQAPTANQAPPFMNQPPAGQPQSALPDAFKPKSGLPDAFKPKAPQPPIVDPNASPFADPLGAPVPPGPTANPYQAPAATATPAPGTHGPQRTFRKPHRADTVMLYAILGLVLCCGPFGIAAWAMGSADLKEMDQGVMDPSGRKKTTSGMTLGVIGAVLFGIGFIIQVALGVLVEVLA